MSSEKNGCGSKHPNIQVVKDPGVAAYDARLGSGEQTIGMRNSGVPVQVVPENEKSSPHNHLVDDLRQNGGTTKHKENEENFPTKTGASVALQMGGVLNTKQELGDQQPMNEPNSGWQGSGEETHEHDKGIKSPVSGFQNSSRIEQAQTFTWIKNNYEEDKDNCLAKHEVYKDYESYCTQHGIRVLGVADFGKVFKCVFPAVTSRRLGPRGQSIYYYNGIRKKPSVPTNTNPCHAIKRENINENDLEEASKLVVCEWAQKLLGHPFSSLRELADFLVSNLYVNSRSAAAFTLIESMNSGENKTAAGTLSPNINKHRETQLQLQKALQLRQLKKKQQEQQTQENGDTQQETSSKKSDKKESPSVTHDNSNTAAQTVSENEKPVAISKTKISSLSGKPSQNSLKVAGKPGDRVTKHAKSSEKIVPLVESRDEIHHKSIGVSSHPEGTCTTKDSSHSTAPRLMNLLLGAQGSKQSQKGTHGGIVSRAKNSVDSASRVSSEGKSGLKEGISAFTPISVNSGLSSMQQQQGTSSSATVKGKLPNPTGAKSKKLLKDLDTKKSEIATSHLSQTLALKNATSSCDSSVKDMASSSTVQCGTNSVESSDNTTTTKPRFLPIKPRVPSNKTVSDLLKEQRGYGPKSDVVKSSDRRPVATLLRDNRDKLHPGNQKVKMLEQSHSETTLGPQPMTASGQRSSLRMSAILKNSQQILKRKKVQEEMDNDNTNVKRLCAPENLPKPPMNQNASQSGNFKGFDSPSQTNLSNHQNFNINIAQGISNQSQTTSILSSIEMDSLLDDPELGSLVNANQLKEAFTYIVQSNSELQGASDGPYSETNLEDVYQNQDETEANYVIQCRSQPVSRAPSTEFKEPPKTPLGKFRPVRTPTGDFHMRSPAVSPTPPSFTEQEGRCDSINSHSLVRPQPARSGASLPQQGGTTGMHPTDDTTLMSPPLVNKPILSRSRRRSGNLVTNTMVGVPPTVQDQQSMASPPAVKRVSFQQQTQLQYPVVSKTPADQAFSNSLAQMLQNIQRQRSGGSHAKFDPNLQRPLYSPGMCRSAPVSAVPSPITWEPRESAPSTPRDSPIPMDNNLSNPGSPYIMHGNQVIQVVHPGSNRSSANNTPTFGMSQQMGSQEDISPQSMVFDQNNGTNTFVSYDNNPVGNMAKRPPSYQVALAHQMAAHSQDQQRSRHHSFPSSRASMRPPFQGPTDFSRNNINFPEGNISQSNASSLQQHKFAAPTAPSSLMLRQRHMSADPTISRGTDFIEVINASQAEEAYDSPFSPEMQAIMDQQSINEEANLQPSDPGTDSSLIQAVESLLNCNTDLDSLPQESSFDMTTTVGSNASSGDGETIKSLLQGKLNVTANGQSNRGLHFAQQTNYQARRNITGMLESNCGSYNDNIQTAPGNIQRNFSSTLPYNDNSSDQYSDVSPDMNFSSDQISNDGQTNWMANAAANPPVPTPPNSQTASPSFSDNLLLLAGQNQQKVNFNSQSNFAFVDDGNCQSEMNYPMYQGNGMPS